MQRAITIPPQLTKQGELVVIPRKEYEALLAFKVRREFSPTAAQKQALRQAEQNFYSGNTLSFHELSRRLGFTH